MRPAVLGIAYYIWLTWRKPLTVALAATVCFGLFSLMPVDLSVRAVSVPLTFATGFCCCAMLATFLDAKGGASFFEVKGEPRIGFPRSLFTLPVRTRTLVFWPWLFGTTGIGLWTVVCGTLFNRLIEPDEVPVAVLAVGLPVCMAWLQVALWTPVRAPLIQGLTYLSGIILPVLLVGWLCHRPGLSASASLTVLVACLALSYPAAVAAVARDRRGDAWLSDLDVTARLWPFCRRAARLPRAFGSLARAQRWYNWWDRRSVLARVMAAPMAAAIGFSFLVSRLGVPGDFPWHFLVCLLFFVFPPLVLLSGRLIVTFPGALGLGPAGMEAWSFVLSFALLRPISSGMLSATFLQSALRGVLWSWAFWLPPGLGACLCWSAFSTVPGSILQELFGRLPAWQIVGVIILSAVAIVLTMWRLTTDGPMLSLALEKFDHWSYAGLSLAIVGLSGVVGFGLSLSLDPATRPLGVDVLAGGGVVILLVKVVVAGLAFRVAHRNGLLEGMSLRTFFLVWPVFAIAFLSATAAVLPGLGLPVPTSLVLVWVAILLPLGRFALLPLSFEALRHR